MNDHHLPESPPRGHDREEADLSEKILRHRLTQLQEHPHVSVHSSVVIPIIVLALDLLRLGPAAHGYNKNHLISAGFLGFAIGWFLHALVAWALSP